MSVFTTSYFRNNTRFLILLGQWPFLSNIRRNIVRSMVFTFVISITIPKVIKCIEVIDDIDGVIECVPMIGLHLISLTKFMNWLINSDKMKHLLLRIETDWKNLKLKQDLKTMKKYYERGRVITSAYTTVMFGCLGLNLASPSIPKIQDILNPLNVSRDRIYLYQTEYFVDPDEYYVPILIHAYMTVPVSVAIIVFVDNIFAMYVHHACGLFTSLRLHLESLHIGIENEQEISNDFSRFDKIREKMAMCINLHKNVLQFYDELESSGYICYSIVLLINLSLITLTIIMVIIKVDEPGGRIRLAAFAVGTIFHVFFSCFIGQKLIDDGDAVFYAVYSFEWYNLPVKLQKSVILIMIRSMKSNTLTAGNIITLSMDTFSMVLRNSMTLFTVLSSQR